ncbi:MAG: hypothetical protein ACP5T1_02530 [Thermoplasmata archaeon]
MGIIENLRKEAESLKNEGKNMGSSFLKDVNEIIDTLDKNSEKLSTDLARSIEREIKDLRSQLDSLSEKSIIINNSKKVIKKGTEITSNAIDSAKPYVEKTVDKTKKILKKGKDFLK